MYRNRVSGPPPPPSPKCHTNSGNDAQLERHAGRISKGIPLQRQHADGQRLNRSQQESGPTIRRLQRAIHRHLPERSHFGNRPQACIPMRTRMIKYPAGIVLESTKCQRLLGSSTKIAPQYASRQRLCRPSGYAYAVTQALSCPSGHKSIVRHFWCGTLEANYMNSQSISLSTTSTGPWVLVRNPTMCCELHPAA